MSEVVPNTQMVAFNSQPNAFADCGDQGLALVKTIPHTPNHGVLMRKLSEAISRADKDEVFSIAEMLVSSNSESPVQVARLADAWLTPGEVAKVAGVSHMTVWRWRNEHGLRFTKIGCVVRIRQSDLEKFLVAHTHA